MTDLNEAIRRLESWSASLAAEVKTTVPEVRKALDPNTRLPDGCPSHESLAALAFGQVEKKFDEVQAAVDDVRKGIWKK